MHPTWLAVRDANFANNSFLYRMSASGSSVDAPVKDVTIETASTAATLTTSSSYIDAPVKDVAIDTSKAASATTSISSIHAQVKNVTTSASNSASIATASSTPSTSLNDKNATISTLDKNSSIEPTTTNPHAIPNTQNDEMKDATNDLLPTTSTSKGKRKAALRSRATINTIATSQDDDLYAETTDDEKPLKKKAKGSKPAAAHIKAQRRGDKGIFIGTHTRDPRGRLPVYAVYYPNGPLNCRVFHEDCSVEVQKEFKEFFHTKAQATMDVIKFDAAIFADTPSIQNLTADQQKQCIRDYLATQGIYRPSNNCANGTSETKAKDSSSSKIPVPSNEFSGPSKMAAKKNAKSGTSNQASSSKASTSNASSSANNKPRSSKGKGKDRASLNSGPSIPAPRWMPGQIIGKLLVSYFL